MILYSLVFYGWTWRTLLRELVLPGQCQTRTGEEWGTPWKSNIDTSNCGLEDVYLFLKMVIFGIYVKFRVCSRWDMFSTVPVLFCCGVEWMNMAVRFNHPLQRSLRPATGGWWCILMCHSYCWWRKSCNSWYGKYPIIFRVLYIPGGAGFLPSTASLPSFNRKSWRQGNQQKILWIGALINPPWMAFWKG